MDLLFIVVASRSILLNRVLIVTTLKFGCIYITFLGGSRNKQFLGGGGVYFVGVGVWVDGVDVGVVVGAEVPKHACDAFIISHSELQ